jgi:hypothetical protein
VLALAAEGLNNCEIARAGVDPPLRDGYERGPAHKVYRSSRLGAATCASTPGLAARVPPAWTRVKRAQDRADGLAAEIGRPRPVPLLDGCVALGLVRAICTCL